MHFLLLFPGIILFLLAIYNADLNDKKTSKLKHENSSMVEIENQLKDIKKSINRIEGKLFANDPFMHQIWDQERKTLNEKNKKAE